MENIKILIDGIQKDVYGIFYLYNSLSTTQTEMEEMVEMMNYEKEQLENEYADVALELEGMSIKVNNDSLLHQLDREQKRVQLLLEQTIQIIS